MPGDPSDQDDSTPPAPKPSDRGVAVKRWLAEHGAVLAIAATWAALTLTLFEPAFRFHGDHERDLRYATLLVQHGIWPDATPAIAPTPFELGPLLYLVLAPIVALSADPVVVRVSFVALTAIALVVLYRLLRRSVEAPAAALAVGALAISEFVFEASTQLWHSSLLALPIALFWTGLDGLIRAPSTRRIVGVAVLSGAMIQLHVTAVAYAAVLLVASLGPLRRALGARRIALGVLAFAVALTPFWVTLARSIARGALARAGGSTHGWSPAPLGELASFFFDNVHPIWGDDLGPALVWPLLALFVVGVAFAARQPLGRLLLVNLAIGLVLEWLLLGNQRAHRYLHANVWAFFLVAGFGAQALFQRLPRRVAAIGAALLGIAVTVEAGLSEVPRADSRGWLNAVEQRAVAEVVAARFPMAEEAMEGRVHGVYFGEPMGMRHWHLLYASDSTATPEEHVLVMPSDLGLAPFGDPTGPRYIVHGSGRDIAIQAFRPAFSELVFSGPAAPDLARRWRRPHAQPGGPAEHTLRFTVGRPGVFTLAIADGRTGDRCRITASVGGAAVASTALDTPDYGWVRFVRLALPKAGGVTVTLGPCRAPAFVDGF